MSGGSTTKKWRLSTGLAFWGMTVQTLFNLIGLCFILYVAYNLTDIAISGILPSVASMSLDYYEDRMMGFIMIVTVCAIIAFLGYLVYLGGICLFRGAQISVDSAARARNIMIVELLLLAFSILYLAIQVNCYKSIYSNFTTLFGYSVLPFIVMLVSIIILLVQYGAFSKENTWSEKARGGAGDVKTSYACLLWMLLVLVIGVGMVALTLFSFYSKLDSLRYSGDDYSGMFDGVNAMSEVVNDLVHTVKAEVLFTEMMILTLSVWSTIKRIVGWRMIQNGGNEEVYRIASKQAAYADTGRFCHKCGMQLPEGSSFCPGCGSAVAVVEVETVDMREPDDSIAPDEASQPESLSSGITIEYEDEEAGKKKKWMLWCGVAAGVLVVAAAIWALWVHNDKFELEPNSKVYADRSIVFKNVEDGVGIEAMEELIFGTPIERLTPEQDIEGKWVRVSYESDGRIGKGYMSKDDMLDTEDFDVLYRAALSDGQARFHLPLKIQRLAVLDAVKSNGASWHLEGVKLFGERQPNAKRLSVSGTSPSGECLGFIMRDSETNERKFFLYSIPDSYNMEHTEVPVFLYSETPRSGEDIVYDAYYRKKDNRYEVIYKTMTEDDGPDSSLFEVIEVPAEEEVTEYADEKQYNGEIELSGHVDGKYPVRMVLVMHDGGSVSGTVTYLKYNVPMELTGTFTDSDDYRDLSLEERSEGKTTGNFIGRYNGKVFSGSWVSADGAKEMPFSVER